MAFEDRFAAIKKAVSSSKADGVDRHLAIQINLNDTDSSGILYLEVKDGILYAEPYDYVDRDAAITVNSADLIKILGGRKSFDKAVADKTLIFEGSEDVKKDFKKLIVKKEKKATVKSTEKTAAKNGTKKDSKTKHSKTVSPKKS